MRSGEAALFILAVVFFTAVIAYIIRHLAGGLFEQITGALG